MNILLVDDDKESVRSVRRFLTKIGHQVSECNTAMQALELLQTATFPLVISDIRMPGLSGLELLQAIKGGERGRETEVVLFTGYGNVDTAVQALRLGAYDYLLKPINVEELAILVERVAERQLLVRENHLLTTEMETQVLQATSETKQELERLRGLLGEKLGLPRLVFVSGAMRKIYEQALRYHADRSIPVLIEGETGVGKEIVARIIHYGESGSAAPFVDLNCATLQPHLFETELFGYEPGAFTGSLAKGQKGKVDLSNGGTLFLDEIGDMPLEIQGKLLRVLQEREFFRIGGLKKIKVDLRLICATNVDLAAEVQRGRFRKDLYYRLNVGRIAIPPLRERHEDILPLAESIIQEFAKLRRKKFRGISESAARSMTEYSWPGNVRELRNVLEWVSFMFDDKEVLPSHLKQVLQQCPVSSGVETEAVRPIDHEHVLLPREGLPLDKLVDRIIGEALRLHNGNKTDTARYLGMSRKSLYCHLKSMERDK